MICKEYPILDERSWQTTLPNGLQLRVIPKPGFARKYAFLAANYGSIDTRFRFDGRWQQTPDGVAHYLEHKMFDLPECNAMQQFSLQGASPNAFTSYAMTAYYFDCTDNFAENLSLLLKMVFTPYFTQESLEKERDIIAQEIKMYDDSADTQASESLYAALFAHHPLRVPIAGTVQSIRDITVDTLYQCHRAFYDPSNMILCVAGDVDPRQVEDIAAAMSPASCGRIGQRDYGPAEMLNREPVIVRRKMEIAMPTFMLGFRAAPLAPSESAMKREFMGDLAAELLMDEGSALYSRLYASNQIDASFGAGYDSIREVGMITAGGDCPEPERVVDEILQEAKAVARRGFEPGAFNRLRKSAIGRRTRGLDNLESFCYRVCAGVFDHVDFYDFPRVYSSITPEETLEFMAQTITPERMALSIIEPNEE